MTINQEIIKVNAPNIVSETIDGEVVIVNLVKGDYYSLFKTAADIWSLIEQGTTRSNIINNLHHNYDCSAIDVADAVEGFLAKIDAEGLIAIVEGELSQEQSLELPESEISQTKFALPVIEKFTDMEELLLLDPIHEADEDKGWPTAKQAV
ncbi:MAG: PqqD family peptide modification chaperone [Cyanobacteria bacterium P01_A01_bin.40]